MTSDAEEYEMKCTNCHQPWIEPTEERACCPNPTKPRAGASVTLSAAMLKEALELIAPDGTPDQMTAEVAIEWSDNGHSGPGYYCWDVEYPDEGAILLGGAR
jgi:hypothetical protein